MTSAASTPPRSASPVRLRSALSELTPLQAGKQPADSDADILRLASNEQPFGPLPSVLDAIDTAAREVHRYPEPTAASLIDALASRLNLPVEAIAVANGSVALIALLAQITLEPGDDAVYGSPSFEAYRVFTKLAGAATTEVPLTSAAAIDLEALAAAVNARTRVVFVCTPNNPTGGTVSHSALAAFVEALPEEVLVVVDEAYVEFVAGADRVDGLALIEAYPNVAVLRTFSKAYGLAGLRVGYCLTHPDIAAAVRAAQPPFTVSRVALEAALASLAATDELEARVAATVAERTRVRDALIALSMPVPPSGGNFLWLPTGEASLDVAAKLEADGILVRCFPGEGLRVTLGEAADNDRVLAAFRSHD